MRARSPEDPPPILDQTSSGSDQTSSDSDQTSSDSDQTSSDSDQMSSDSDQLAADQDQAASDRDLAAGLDPRVHEASRDMRERSARQRELATAARLEDAERRDASARARDRAADDRDRAAEARDAAMREFLTAIDGGIPRTALERLLRASEQRRRAREFRAMAADYRAKAARDRRAAAEDREHAQRERERARHDRQALLAELAAAAIDPVTGARMRGPGLADLEHEMQRSRRTGAGLVVAYLDVVGLKARNDARGHAAGDMLLKRVATAIADHLRPYDLVVRVGGDEFVYAMSGAGLAEIRSRSRRLADALRAGEDPLEITTGFAELRAGDTLTALIARADREMIEQRRSPRPG